jgi:hypothetical protein
MKLIVPITAAAALIAIGGFTMAQNSAALCQLDDGFYKTHEDLCDAVLKVPGMRQRLHRRSAQEELRGAFMDGDHTITIRRDPQAPDTGGHVQDAFYALQTTDDVAKSRAYGSAGGWYVSANDMYRKHPVFNVAAAPRSAARKTVAQTPVGKVVAQQ